MIPWWMWIPTGVVALAYAWIFLGDLIHKILKRRRVR